jgi:hypothetical protein
MKIYKEKFRSVAGRVGPRCRAAMADQQVGPTTIQHKEGGFIATVQFIALLSIMMLLATANAMALYHLHRNVRFLEQQQIKRLNASQTNSVAAVRFNLTSAESK